MNVILVFRHSVDNTRRQYSVPGRQTDDEGKSSEADGERTGVKPQTERGHQTEDSQGSLGGETETLPEECCQTQSQEHQLGLQMIYFFCCPDWNIFGQEGHRNVLLRYQTQLRDITD